MQSLEKGNGNENGKQLTRATKLGQFYGNLMALRSLRNAATGQMDYELVHTAANRVSSPKSESQYSLSEGLS